MPASTCESNLDASLWGTGPSMQNSTSVPVWVKQLLLLPPGDTEMGLQQAEMRKRRQALAPEVVSQQLFGLVKSFMGQFGFYILS